MWLLLPDRIFEVYIDTGNYYSTIDKSMFQKLQQIHKKKGKSHALRKREKGHYFARYFCFSSLPLVVDF